MENFIKKIKALLPTEEQTYPNNPTYSFGWVDAVNATIKLVKEFDFTPLAIEPSTIECNMYVWHNDELFEVEFINDGLADIKELKSGVMFMVHTSELKPVR